MQGSVIHALPELEIPPNAAGEEFGTAPGWDLLPPPWPGLSWLFVPVPFQGTGFEFFGFSIICTIFGWIEQLVPESRFRFPHNLSLQMLVLQCSVKWCFAFYVLEQHMVCSQLLKLTKYLRIYLNARSYRKCKFITSHLILTIDFWRVLWGFFFLVLSLLCLHVYADFLSLPEPHNTCYQ